MRNFLVQHKDLDPFLAEFDLGRLFGDFFRPSFRIGLTAIETLPALDIYEKENNVVVKAEIPGVKPDDIKLSVDGNILTISGEKNREKEVKKENYYRAERAHGHFQRLVELPTDVKAEEAKATHKNGVLKIELPKATSQQKKEIKIDIA
jgi:HSP20 family protein